MNKVSCSQKSHLIVTLIYPLLLIFCHSVQFLHKDEPSGVVWNQFYEGDFEGDPKNWNSPGEHPEKANYFAFMCNFIDSQECPIYFLSLSSPEEIKFLHSGCLFERISHNVQYQVSASPGCVLFFCDGNIVQHNAIAKNIQEDEPENQEENKCDGFYMQQQKETNYGVITECSISASGNTQTRSIIYDEGKYNLNLTHTNFSRNKAASAPSFYIEKNTREAFHFIKYCNMNENIITMTAVFWVMSYHLYVFKCQIIDTTVIHPAPQSSLITCGVVDFMSGYDAFFVIDQCFVYGNPDSIYTIGSLGSLNVMNSYFDNCKVAPAQMGSFVSFYNTITNTSRDNILQIQKGNDCIQETCQDLYQAKYLHSMITNHGISLFFILNH